MNDLFPKNFLFGGAISACQAEGAWDIDGKVLTFPEIVKRIKPEERKTFKQAKVTKEVLEEGKTKDPSNYPKRWGIDFYHTYKEDIALFSEMGFRVLRISLPISRIFPDLKSLIPNEKALMHYDDMINEIKRHGMEPLITISHFDPPISVWEEFGGWCNRNLIDIYYKYGKTLLDRYHKLVKYWVPFNEINAAIHAPYKGAGLIYEEGKEYEIKCWQSAHNQMVTASKIVNYAHKNYPDLKMGCMIAYVTRYPLSTDPLDVFTSERFVEMNEMVFLDVLAKGKYPYYALKYFSRNNIVLNITEEDKEILSTGIADWIGFSYYQSGCIAYDETGKETAAGNLKAGLKNPLLEVNEWGWQMDPIGLRTVCNRLYDRYNKPLFILENGLGKIEQLGEDYTVHDQYRIQYLREHLSNVKKAIIEDGCEILGYTWWSPIDLISSASSEMSKRYGFIYVDQDDDGNGSKKRYKKDSFFAYKSIIETNGKDL